MHTGRIIEYGPQAQSVLKEQHGDIFAVFSNSVYLRGNGNIFCLGTEQLVSGPLNMSTDLPLIRGLSVGDPWVYSKATLTLGNRYRLGTETAHCWNRGNRFTDNIADQSTLLNLPPSILVIEQTLSNHLVNIVSEDSDQLTAKLVHQQLQQLSTQLNHFLQQSVYASKPIKLPTSLKGLIGCGDGLTPAGDDILVGVLTTLHHFNHSSIHSQLQRWVTAHAPDRTNHISLAHLIAACNGQAIELVHNVLDAVCTIDPLEKNKLNSLSATVTALTKYGHSSGYYALTGVLMVLKALVK